LASFCTAVDIPIFPISPLKLSLFLSQALEIVLFDITSQPLRFPLPTVNPNDRSNLTPDEGTRLTRELAEAWIQALGFAQLATARTWEKMALSPASLVPLSEDGTIREILAAIPSIQDWTRYEAMVDLPLKAREKPSSKTRWVRGGKPVEGPMQAFVLLRTARICQVLTLSRSLMYLGYFLLRETLPLLLQPRTKQARSITLTPFKCPSLVLRHKLLSSRLSRITQSSILEETPRNRLLKIRLYF